LARRLANERGIDLSTITGTGPGGRITEADVPEHAAPDPVPATVSASASATPHQESELVELSRMRQAIARVTVDSKREAPHFYVAVEIDMTKAMLFRRDVNDEVSAEQRVSVNDLIVKASAMAIKHHPKFNSSFQDNHLQMNASVNIGIAIALDSGLIIPGINNCESKSLIEISTASRDLVSRANSGTLRNEEYSGTTFSVSNLGMFDVDSFTAIIFPPHAAILAVGTVKEQPVVRDGELAIAQIMKATISTDHRVADGAEAAQFISEIKKYLENPISLVI
jgi:pyruvate dehydrogenase E2 component (dihydrolipoamide acetyltransferase)